MKNTMISNKETESVRKICGAVDEFLKSHEHISIEQVMRASQVEKIHMLLYMELVKDLVESSKAMLSLLEEDEYTFIKIITDDGKKSLDDVEKHLMAHMLLDMVGKK